MQLCSTQRCCVVTACRAEGRIKWCRCVWGNRWRAFEEEVSHSSQSSSRTGLRSSHLLRFFFPSTIRRSVWHRPSQAVREHLNTNSSSLVKSRSTCHPVSLLIPFPLSPSFFPQIYLFDLSGHSSAPFFGPFTVLNCHSDTGTGTVGRWPCKICHPFNIRLFSLSRLLCNSQTSTCSLWSPLLSFMCPRLLSWPRPCRRRWRWKKPSRELSRERTARWSRSSPLWLPERESHVVPPRNLPLQHGQPSHNGASEVNKCLQSEEI